MASTTDTTLARSEQAGTVKLKRQTFGDLSSLEAAMKQIAASANLIAPMVALDHIPMFHEVSLRVVSIDPASETFEVQGGRALSKTALAKLSQAARISWDSRRSGRLDDGSDPRYVHFRAVGWWPDFDGKTVLEISGEKQMDLRDGSPMVEKLKADAARKSRDAEAQIREVRGFILEHAESKARNRAIRQALALKSKYTEIELKRPFVVPTLIETGRCDDPDLKVLYYEKKLSGMGLATRALFGGDPMLRDGRAEIIEVKAQAEPKAPPPPVGSASEEEDQDGYDPFASAGR